MAALSKVLRIVAGSGLAFWCPGCGEPHVVTVAAPGVSHPCWTWNGDADRPTFSPSILIRSGHYASGFDPERDECWCTYNREHPDAPASFACAVCHIFVREGKAQFLADCSHALAGKTVALPSWPEDYGV